MKCSVFLLAQFWGWADINTHRVRHLKSRVHQAEDIVAVTGLQTDNIVNDIVHLKQGTAIDEGHAGWSDRTDTGWRTEEICVCRCETERDLTSFSQLAFKVSKAIGLLGALLPGPGGMPPWSEDWLGQGKLRTCEPSFPRYRFTCCCWERWMWYLVGFSRWVWTCRSKKKSVRRVACLEIKTCK